VSKFTAENVFKRSTKDPRAVKLRQACDVIMGKDERNLIKIKFYENYDKIEKKAEPKKFSTIVDETEPLLLCHLL
jgi:hypothetical protein